MFQKLNIGMRLYGLIGLALIVAIALGGNRHRGIRSNPGEFKDCV